MASSQKADFGGARGSNTGDDFHEFWAMRQALRLIERGSKLSAMALEGLTADAGTGNEWDGVDCTLLYGAEREATADRVEIQQLKYSAANASASWTVSRISTAKTARLGSSVIGKMATAYTALVAKRKTQDPTTVLVQLVTNQRIDDALIKAIDEAKALAVSNHSKRPRISSDLRTLAKASGLALPNFCNFARSLDLVGATGSRFRIEDDVLKRISQWEDIEFVEIAGELRRYVHDLMLPERAGEFVTPHDVLLKLGAGDPSVLFPAPSYIDRVDQPVRRPSISRAAQALKGNGHQYFCLHGNGGLGKTTALQLIAEELPAQSLMVVFDCYGAGSYLDASKSRHRQKEAFVQLANEVAERLKLPTYLVPRSHTDFPRAMRRRIDEASKLLSSLNAKALLVVTADAIDNALSAARSKQPPEPNFAQDLMSFEDLPTNVRILITCRTSRLSELSIPARFQRIELEPFTLQETTEYVRKFWNADDDWIDEFHKLSKGVPRVQSYALKSAPDDHSQAIDALRPDGKALDQIFQTQLVESFRKHGDEREIRRFCAAVTHLPRPVPIDVLSSILNVSSSALADIVADLVPGFTLVEDKIGFADEDFEAYAREAGATHLLDVARAAADHFLETASTSGYAALAVVPMMFSSGQHENLLNFVEGEPEPPVGLLPDFAIRREIGIQRLRTAIQVCRTAGNNSRALRFIMMGAEAVHSDDNLRQFLIEHRSLSVRFAEDSVRRLILRDPDYVADHGPILLQMIGRLAGSNNRSAARELRKRANAWFRLRWDTYQDDVAKDEHARAWPIGAEDFAHILYADLNTTGVASAVSRYRGLRPWRFAMDAGLATVDRLLAEGKFEIVNEIADSLPLHRAVFVLVPLAMSGAVVDLARLEDGVRALSALAKPSAKLLERYGPHQEIGPKVVDMIISGVELLVMRGRHPKELKSLLSPFLDLETRRIDRLYSSDHVLLDAVMRSYFLCEAIEGRTGKNVDPLIPRPKPEEQPNGGRSHQDADRHDRELREVVGAVSRIYAWRAQFIAEDRPVVAADGLAQEALTYLSENAWRINRHYDASGMRSKAAESIATLAGEPTLSKEIVRFSLSVRNRGWSGGERSADTLFARLRNVKALHDDLVSSIANEADSVKRNRIGAEDKSSVLARFSEWLLWISPDDSSALFETALEVAAELDSEIMDQIRAVAALAERGHSAVNAPEMQLARAFSDVLEDAGIRLENVEGFPWDAGMRTLVLLDLNTALSCSARWQDTDVASFHHTLNPLIDQGVKQRQLSTGQSASLMLFLREVEDEAVVSVIDAAREHPPTCVQLSEYFAKNILLERVALGDAATSLVMNKGSGRWSDEYKKQKHFVRLLEEAPSEQPIVTQTGSPRQQSETIQVTWTRDDLTDSERLREKLEKTLTEARDQKRYVSSFEILATARTAVDFADRVAHLDALITMKADISDTDFVSGLLAALSEWKSQPAVQRWCRTKLPDAISEYLPTFSRYFPRDDGRLDRALELSEASTEQVLSILMSGVERNVGVMSASALFAIVGRVAISLSADEARKTVAWYIRRLHDRLADEDKASPDVAELPTTTDEALGRFVFSLLGDVDVYVRWRAAHAIRCLADFGESSTFAALWDQFERANDIAFRQPDAPYYWLASRLWLLIATDRIALDFPSFVEPVGRQLFSIATDNVLPHILMRDYAADACRKLVLADTLSISDLQKNELKFVNKSLLPKGTKKERNYGSFNFFDQSKNPSLRFHFDAMDTLRYWYSSWIGIFEDLTEEEFIETADRYISDVWGVIDERPYGSREKRKARFNDRSWQRSSHSHGSLPTLERYQSYLEWHAMWCAGGEALLSHRLAQHDWDYGSLDYEIGLDKLTAPPVWLSDLVGSRPLLEGFWRSPQRSIDDWRKDATDEEILAEVMVADRPGYLAVDQSTTTASRAFRHEVSVSTGLVSSDAAHALVRALQTTWDDFDYRIPPEGDDLEIDDGDYVLRGWLKSNDGDSRFDRTDRFCNGVRRIECEPGRVITRALGLNRDKNGAALWFRSNDSEPTFIYEAWGHPEVEDDREIYYDDCVRSDGYRLLVRISDLAEFLHGQGMELIMEVGLRRDKEGKRSSSYDDKESTEVKFDRLFIFGMDGTIRAAERDVGAWRQDC
jgi:NACHT domain